MAYTTRVTGRITISPRIPWSKIKCSRFLLDHSGHRGLDHRSGDREPEVRLIAEASGVGAEGLHVGVAAEPRYPGEAFSNYHLTHDLQALIDEHPTHTFIGHFDCAGEDAGDIWRLEVRDGRAVEVRPYISWIPCPASNDSTMGD